MVLKRCFQTKVAKMRDRNVSVKDNDDRLQRVALLRDAYKSTKELAPHMPLQPTTNREPSCALAQPYLRTDRVLRRLEFEYGRTKPAMK